MDSLFIYATTAAALKMLLLHLGWNKRPKNAECVGRVTTLKIYPVKSMKGLPLERAECTFRGLKLPGHDVYDRCWMVTLGDDYRFVTARQEPTLLHIQTGLSGEDTMTLDAPSMNTLRVPLRVPHTASLAPTKVWGEEVDGWDCGDEAADWISRFLGNKPGHRIICHNPNDVILKSRSAYSVSRKPMITRDCVKPTDRLSFHDDGPYLLTVDASLEDLNAKLKLDAVSMETFRPTINISGDTSPFEEDNWYEIFIGDHVKFTTMMPCSRCMLTTFDPTTAIKRSNNEPVHTLKSYRRILKTTESPCFGTYLVCDREGTIQLNDPVYVIRK